MVAGLNPPAFHVVNIASHAVVSLLVVLLVEAVLRDRPLAVVAGLLFAAHPVHTEAVTGIVGRAEVLSALFLLVALYVQARDFVGRGRGRSVWVPVGLLAYFCALASKETAIVGPGLAALVDYVRQGCETLGSSGQRRRWDVRRTLGVVGLYVAVAVVYLLIRYSVVGRFIQKPSPRSYTLLFGQPFGTRVFTGAGDPGDLRAIAVLSGNAVGGLFLPSGAVARCAERSGTGRSARGGGVDRGVRVGGAAAHLAGGPCSGSGSSGFHTRSSVTFRCRCRCSWPSACSICPRSGSALA